MRSTVIQNEVDQMVNRYIAKGENLKDSLILADKYLDEKLKNDPLVILFHEMKKEIQIRHSEI